MYCQYCGAFLDEDATFCQFCGTRQDSVSTQTICPRPIPIGNPVIQNHLSNKTNMMAILGLIFSFLMPVFGLAFSIMGLNQIKKTGEKGKGLAIAGLIISPVIFIIALVIQIANLIYTI